MRMLRYAALAGVMSVVVAGAAHAAETLSEIPEAFQGVFSDSLGTCGDKVVNRKRVENTTLMRVRGPMISLYDAQAEVKLVRVYSDVLIEVDADWSGEGKTWSATNRLILQRGGESLTLTGYGRKGLVAKVRCP